MNHSHFISFALLFSALVWIGGCEGGLEPPMEETNPTGVITGIVTYSGEWPSADSLKDLRFVPLKTKPQTAQDIIAEFTKNPVFSNQLDYFAEQDTFLVENVPNGTYVYNAIAQRYGNQLFSDWRPVGVYQENDGIIIVDGDSTFINIHVDFDNLPPFNIE
ncbi:MAG: hypothetical protein R3220_07915 [Balneolaceae bacterium]|nr:hypothetical protein [Balneolaceae bacterium]